MGAPKDPIKRAEWIKKIKANRPDLRGEKNLMYGKPGTNLGKKFTEEHKLNISKANKGKKMSEEFCKKVSERQMGKTYEERFGIKKAQEIKEKKNRKLKGRKILWADKISKAQKGRNYEELFGEEEAKKLKEKIRKARAKQIFPKHDTKIEVKIQMFLEELGYEYFTHQYMKDIEHGYQCDILIPYLNLVIECDGDYWHKYPIGTDIDHIRTSELLEKGFKVLRLWECEIKEMNINKFKEDLDIIKRED